MSLSTCQHCGGHIPLGPDATNRCEDCGEFIFGSPMFTCPTPKVNTGKSVKIKLIFDRSFNADKFGYRPETHFIKLSSSVYNTLMLMCDETGKTFQELFDEIMRDAVNKVKNGTEPSNP